MGAYHFRSLVEADLSLIAHWRASPHVQEWWGAPSVEDEREKLGDPRIAMWIVEVEGRPFAFAQDYDVHGWNPHPFSYLPPQSRGIDQYIGEADMLDQGHGSAFVRQHVERLFAAGAPAVGTDPSVECARSPRLREGGLRGDQRTGEYAVGPRDPHGVLAEANLALDCERVAAGAWLHLRRAGSGKNAANGFGSSGILV